MKINTILCTRNGLNFGNAIIIKVSNDKFTIKTDYGNVVELTGEEIERNFYVCEVAAPDHKHYVSAEEMRSSLAY